MSKASDQHLGQLIRRKTLAGFLTVVPFGLAFLVCKWLFHFVEGIVTPAVFIGVKALGLPRPPSFFMTLLGVSIMILLFFLVGLASSHYFGKRLVAWSEALSNRIPIYRNVYNAVKQVVDTLSYMEKKAFQEAVLVEYPRRGMYSVAFVTNEIEGGVEGLTSESLLTVFVPTAPNPTSGFVIMVPRQDCMALDVTVEEAMRFIFSAGVVPVHRHATPEEVANAMHEPVGS